MHPSSRSQWPKLFQAETTHFQASAPMSANSLPVSTGTPSASKSGNSIPHLVSSMMCCLDKTAPIWPQHSQLMKDGAAKRLWPLRQQVSITASPYPPSARTARLWPDHFSPRGTAPDCPTVERATRPEFRHFPRCSAVAWMPTPRIVMTMAARDIAGVSGNSAKAKSRRINSTTALFPTTSKRYFMP